MAAITFFSYFFLGCGPGIMFFLAFLSNKSFISLLVLFSAFTFLTVLLITSSIFRGFYPINASIGSYAGVIAASVFMEEVTRYGVWRLHKVSVPYIERMSRTTGTTFTLLDKMYMALGWGYGHGLCHVVFFFVSYLYLTASDGTYYLDTCPKMSLFLVGALYSIGFGTLLPSLMVIYFEGCHQGSLLHMVSAPLLHTAASMITIINLLDGGCMYVMPIIVVMGLSSAAYAGHLCWSKLIKDDYKQANEVPLTLPARSDSLSSAADSHYSHQDPRSAVVESAVRVATQSRSTTLLRATSMSQDQT